METLAETQEIWGLIAPKNVSQVTSAAILMSTKKGALETVILPSSDEMNDYIIH